MVVPPIWYRSFHMNSAPIASLTKGVQNSLQNIQSNVQNSLNQFSNPSNVTSGMTSAVVPTVFLTSNSIFAKIGFILLVLIVFFYVLSLGVSILGYFLQSSSSPYLVYGTLDGFDNKIIPADPRQPNSIAVFRSNNSSFGAEFSWAVWLNIRNNDKTYQHIFNKGDTNFASNGEAAVNNAPGLYVTSNTTSSTNQNEECILHVVMDTVDPSIGHQIIDVEGLPYNQWFLVIVRLENKMLDVYINGVITNRLSLAAVPKQNYNDINICQNGGFSGKLSNLRYYNYALSVFEINGIVVGGPNTSVSNLSSNKQIHGSPYYLSSSWYNTQYVGKS
jgi:Concanavalin A-like lectin/glucanases superfamily